MEHTIEHPVALYDNLDILGLTAKLDVEIYDKIVKICNNVEIQGLLLSGMEVNPSVLHYAVVCRIIAGDTIQCITSKKEDFIPYLKTLSEREEEGHDCSSCNSGGACNVNHDLQMMALKNTNLQIKDLLNGIQMASLPLYTETVKTHEYKLLRSDMALLSNRMTHLLMVEELFLMPKIKEAQRKINVRA